MPTITFEKENKTIEVGDGVNLRRAGLENGIPTFNGLLSKYHLHLPGLKNHCVVEITNVSKIAKRTADEEAGLRGSFIFAKAVTPNLHLACQVVVNGDMTVNTQPEQKTDPIETRERMKFAMALGGFGLLTLLAILMIFFDFAALM